MIGEIAGAVTATANAARVVAELAKRDPVIARSAVARRHARVYVRDLQVAHVLYQAAQQRRMVARVVGGARRAARLEGSAHGARAALVELGVEQGSLDVLDHAAKPGVQLPPGAGGSDG